MKKLLPYILILSIFAGLLSPLTDVNAQATAPAADPVGKCVVVNLATGLTDSYSGVTKKACQGHASTGTNSVSWTADGSTTGEILVQDSSAPIVPLGPTDAEKAKQASQTGFQNEIDQHICSINPIDFNLGGCLVQLAYYTIYTIPAFLLGIAATFFNAIIAISLSSTMISQSKFIQEGWTVVRDLSNIFFILILLYVAIQMILGLGGGHGKKIIVQVIIMALLINFSMFLTEIVIDTSNVIALVFYNKLHVTTKDDKPIGGVPVTIYQEKDLSAAMVNTFDPTSLLTPSFFEKARDKTQVVLPGFFASIGIAAINTALGPGSTSITDRSTGRLLGYYVPSKEVSTPTLLAIMFIAGGVMLSATYCFVVSGFSFLARLIELLVLIIFSPFAFMSSTLPLLEKVPDIGWKSWFDRLLTVSFMAPVFMFFLYFIFLLIHANIFSDLQQGDGTISTIIFTVLPAAIILTLLLRATSFAKKGSGKIGEMLTKTAGIVTGIVGGIAIGGAAAGLQGTLGHAGKNLFESKTLADWETKGNWAERRLGSTLRTLGGGSDGKGGMAGSSFDLRQGVLGGVLKAASSATGLNLGAQSKMLLKESGGYEADLKRRDAKRKTRAEGLKIKEGEEEKQTLNRYQEDHQTVSIANEIAIHDVELRIAGAEKTRANLEKVFTSANQAKDPLTGRFVDPETEKKRKDFEKAADDVRKLQLERGDIKNGGYDVKTGQYRTHNGEMSKYAANNIISQAAAENTATVNAAQEYALARAAADAAPADAALAAAADAAENRRKEAENANTVARAMASAAKAAMAVSEAEKAAAKALRNPSDATLVANARTKEQEKIVALRRADTDAQSVTTLATTDANFANAARATRKLADKANRGLGNSQNDYEDDLLPHQKHVVEEVSKGRARAYANNIENQWAFPWNAAARKKSAHEIRMGAKPEKTSKGSSHFAEGVAAEFIGAKLFGEGGHGGAAGHAAAASAAGGDAHGAAPSGH